MRHSIPYYIREQLREDRTVCVPGVGVFELLQRASAFSDGKSSITPPQLSLNFAEQHGDIVRLVERISIVENLPVDKVEKKLMKYADKLFNKLINLNKVEIEGVGTLQKTDTDRIHFSDAVASLTDEYNGLQSIRLKPIQHMANSEPNLDTPRSGANPTADYPQEVAKSRPWWIPIMGGLLLALIYVMTQKSCDGNNPVNLLGDSEEVIEEPVVADTKEDIAVAEEATEAELSEPLASDTDYIDVENEATETDSRTPAEIDAEVKQIEEQLKKEIAAENLKAAEASKLQQLADEKSQQRLAEAQAAEAKRQQAAAKVEAAKAAKAQKGKAASTESSGTSAIQSVSYDGSTCIIIVGAFGKAKNTLRMMDRIERLGYKVYSAEHNGLTRVGLQFTCKEQDLDRYIAEARTKLESNAWYLQSPKQ